MMDKELYVHLGPSDHVVDGVFLAVHMELPVQVVIMDWISGRIPDEALRADLERRGWPEDEIAAVLEAKA
jgi:hypothetical protein